MHHCGKFDPRLVSRREMLSRCATGFGAMAFTALLSEAGVIGEVQASEAPGPKARAKRVIFLYMDGGPSQVDTFDPKPRLAKEHGQPFKMKMEPTQFNNNGSVLASPWEFKQYGESGMPISSLFPHVARNADELCVIRSMTSAFSEHTAANYFLHTGLGLVGRPSVGAWVTYGLGSESKDLPGFVVINGGLIPPGGTENFGNGFLPAAYQGSIFRPNDPPVANIKPSEESPELQKNKLALVHDLDQQFMRRFGRTDQLEASIANYELAFKMQAAVPELMDLGQEPESVRKMYGLDADFEPTRIFGRECLLARRLVQRGVRFIELTCPAVSGDRWDQHGGLKSGHENNARAVDQPIGALLADLKGLGLLEDTLVLWAGEFGRTPFAQGSDGRDHNPFGYSVWLAGGGVKRGCIYGATDDYGYKAIENKVEMYDLHATMLHLLGVDHKKLTYRFGGRDMRLTDVHGEIITSILG